MAHRLPAKDAPPGSGRRRRGLAPRPQALQRRRCQGPKLLERRWRHLSRPGDPTTSPAWRGGCTQVMP